MPSPEPAGSHAATGISRCSGLCGGCVAARRRARSADAGDRVFPQRCPALLRLSSAAFRSGLKGAGFVEGLNMAIESLLGPSTTATVCQHSQAISSTEQVAVIVGEPGGSDSRRTATSTLPIVFVSGTRSPVRTRLW